MNSNRLTERFFRYVKCASESRNEADFCKLLEDELIDLGLEVRRDHAGEQCGSNGWNIFARLDGTGNPILFSTHLDTVYPGNNIKPVLESGIIRSSSDTILGADDKAGIAAVMEALECISENGCAHRTVEVLFTLCEEIGMLGAKYADYKNIQSREAIVLDSDNLGEIINRNPANVVLHFIIDGKSAHAGLAPQEGIHALKAAAQAVAAIPVGYVDDISAMNISNFISEGKTNVVADKAAFDMEIRSFDEERLQQHIKSSENAVRLACKSFGANYEMSMERHSDVIHIPEKSPLITDVIIAYQSLGVKYNITRSFGGCDATYLFAHGIDVLNIGIGMQAVHSSNEHISVNDLKITSELVYAIIINS
ncbi:MAG: M20/M25/M40 family metallo-hydrolase [Eubacteriales bacterium]